MDHSIQWDNPVPNCSCGVRWCESVTNHVASSTDFLYVEDRQTILVPLARTPSFRFKYLPTATVKVELADNGRFRVTDYLTDEVGGFLLGTEMHRRSVTGLVVPILAQWEMDHPCGCNHVSTGLINNFTLQALALVAAYRDGKPDTCWDCDMSDLIPDVPGGNLGNPVPSAISHEFPF